MSLVKDTGMDLFIFENNVCDGAGRSESQILNLWQLLLHGSGCQISGDPARQSRDSSDSLPLRQTCYYDNTEVVFSTLD